MSEAFTTSGILLATILLFTYYIQKGFGGMSVPLRQFGMFLLTKAAGPAAEGGAQGGARVLRGVDEYQVPGLDQAGAARGDQGSHAASRGVHSLQLAFQEQGLQAMPGPVGAALQAHGGSLPVLGRPGDPEVRQSSMQPCIDYRPQ